MTRNAKPSYPEFYEQEIPVTVPTGAGAAVINTATRVRQNPKPHNPVSTNWGEGGVQQMKALSTSQVIAAWYASGASHAPSSHGQGRRSHAVPSNPTVFEAPQV